ERPGALVERGQPAVAAAYVRRVGRDPAVAQVGVREVEARAGHVADERVDRPGAFAGAGGRRPAVGFGRQRPDVAHRAAMHGLEVTEEGVDRGDHRQGTSPPGRGSAPWNGGSNGVQCGARVVILSLFRAPARGLEVLDRVGEVAFAGGVDHLARLAGQLHAVLVELLLDPAADLARVAVFIERARRRAELLAHLRGALAEREAGEG